MQHFDKNICNAGGKLKKKKLTMIGLFANRRKKMNNHSLFNNNLFLQFKITYNH